MNEKIVNVDVRALLNSGRDPFSYIMQAVHRLAEDEDLELIAPIEPIPLYEVMKKKGYFHTTRRLGENDFVIRFTRQARADGFKDPPGESPASHPHASFETLTMDLRGFDLPESMVQILKKVETLSSQIEIRVLTDRRPIQLYALLAEHGCSALTDPNEDGSYLTRIRRRQP